jgi:acyl carrier protein
MDFNASQKAVDATSRARNLVAIVTDLARELRGSRASVNVTLSSRLDRDLGIDSLGRTELVLRIERLFRIRLPVTIIGEADTVQDILTALERAAVQQGTPDIRDVIVAEAPIAAQPVVAAAEAKTLIEALEWHVARNPDRVHVTVLQDERTAHAAITA